MVYNCIIKHMSTDAILPRQIEKNQHRNLISRKLPPIPYTGSYISLAATPLQALLQTLQSIGFAYSSVLCKDSHGCPLLRSKLGAAVQVCCTVLIISINNLSIMG